jgi:hypothetical protein
MAGVPWRQEEIERLRSMVSQGSTAYEVAKTLGRSIGGVTNKASSEGIKFNEGKTLTPQTPEFTVTSAPAGDLQIEDIFEIKSKQFNLNSERKAVLDCLPIDIHIDGPIGIALIGDPHLDDDNCDLMLIKSHVETISSTEGLLGLCVGDYTNNWVGRLEKLYSKQLVTRKYAHVLCEWFFSSVNWLVAVGGNHDAWNHGNEIFRYMARLTETHYAEHGGRFLLKFPNGNSCILNTRHDYKGRSQYSPSFGPAKEALFGYRDNLHVAGHLHQDSYQTHRIAGRRIHAIRVGSYKRFDEYAVEHGFAENDNSPAYMAVIDPSKDSNADGFIVVFSDFDTGVDYLNALRSKLAA